MTRALRIGSFCTGYGGLDMAVESVLGGDLAWVADNDPGASKVLAHRFPGVPNLGDITAVNWADVEPVDVLCAGFPCQDISYAGQGDGIQEGNRSGLWYVIADAIGVLRPGLVLLENVSAIVARRPGLDVVTASLARIGYVGSWLCLRASDIGACHGRNRWFAIAYPDGGGLAPHVAGSIAQARAETAGGRSSALRGSDNPAQDADSAASGERRLPAPGQEAGGRPRADAGGSGGAPDFQSLAAGVGSNGGDPGGEGLEIWSVEHYGPERPAAERGRGDDAPADAQRDGLRRRAGAPGEADSSRPGSWPAAEGCRADASADAERGRRAGRSPDEERPAVGRVVAARSGDSSRHAPADPDRDGLARGEERGGWPQLSQALREQRRVDPLGRVLDWGIYEPAIRRHELVFGRPAPAPTEPGRGGKPRLSPRLNEWMMGLPEGWVTDVPGLSRNDMLRVLGNGVVPQCATVAYSLLLPAWLEAMAA